MKVGRKRKVGTKRPLPPLTVTAHTPSGPGQRGHARGTTTGPSTWMHNMSSQTVQWAFSATYRTNLSMPQSAQTHAFYPPGGPVPGQQYASTLRTPSAWPSWPSPQAPLDLDLDPEEGLLDTVANAFDWDNGTLDTCLRVSCVKAAGKGRAYLVHLGTLSAPLSPAPMVPRYRVEW